MTWGLQTSSMFTDYIAATGVFSSHSIEYVMDILTSAEHSDSDIRFTLIPMTLSSWIT